MLRVQNFKSAASLRLSNSSTPTVQSFDSEHFLEVGYVKSAHGVRGELFVVLNELHSHDPVSWGHLYLLHNKSQKQQVLKIQKMKLHKGGYITSVDGVKDRNQSEALKGYGVWRPQEEFTSKPGEEVFLREVLGFMVSESNFKKDLGSVVGFSSNGAQDLLVVEKEEKTFEIPFIEEFIVSIDFDHKKIEMDLPEGLVE